MSPLTETPEWREAILAAATKMAELQRCECFPLIGTPHIHGGLSRPCLIHAVEADFLVGAALPALERLFTQRNAEKLRVWAKKGRTYITEDNDLERILGVGIAAAFLEGPK